MRILPLFALLAAFALPLTAQAEPVTTHHHRHHHVHHVVHHSHHVAHHHAVKS
jgi:hypothetical protein